MYQSFELGPPISVVHQPTSLSNERETDRGADYALQSASTSGEENRWGRSIQTVNPATGTNYLTAEPNIHNQVLSQNSSIDKPFARSWKELLSSRNLSIGCKRPYFNISTTKEMGDKENTSIEFFKRPKKALFPTPGNTGPDTTTRFFQTGKSDEDLNRHNVSANDKDGSLPDLEIFSICCAAMIESDLPDLLESMLSACTDPEEDISRFMLKTTGCSILHYAISKGRRDCARVIMDNRPGLLTSATSKAGILPVHVAALHGQLDCLRDIIERSPHHLYWSDRYYRLPLHHAVRTDQDVKHNLDCIQFLVEQDSDTILACDKNGVSPMDEAIINHKTEVLACFLQQSGLTESLEKITKFNNFVTHLAYFIQAVPPDYLTMIRQAIKKIDSPLPRPLEWPITNRHKTDDGRNFFLHYQYLKKRVPLLNNPAIDHKKITLNVLHLEQARNLLTDLGSIGVYGNVNFIKSGYAQEQEGQFWSMGDISASIQMIDALIDLGAKEIKFWFTITQNGTCSSMLQADEQTTAQQTGLSNLSYLFGTRIYDMSGAQTIQRDGATISILPLYTEAARQVSCPVTLSFHNVAARVNACRPMCDNFITVKAYRFWSFNQFFIANIQGDYGHPGLLSLPTNSIIPIKQDNARQLPHYLVLSDSIQQPRSGLSVLAPSATDLSYPCADAIETLCSMQKDNQLHISVVYGLHHHDIDITEKATILLNWMNAINNHLQAANDSKPVVIALFTNTQSWDFIDHLPSTSCEKVIRFVDDNTLTQLQNLSRGKVVIGLMPSLPRHVFDELVCCSDYPALAEGANLTSLLLQHGHHFLSVLPSGLTAVAQDMGDPYEAMREQAFSYKLNLDELSYLYLDKFSYLVKNQQYEAALGYMQAIKNYEKKLTTTATTSVENNVADGSQQDTTQTISTAEKQCVAESLRFLWGALNDGQNPFSAPLITVKSLLEQQVLLQRQGKSLGHRGLQVLESTVDPSKEAMVSYLKNCLDKESTISHHVSLKQLHLLQPFNNAIAMALVTFARHKKWYCSGIPTNSSPA